MSDIWTRKLRDIEEKVFSECQYDDYDKQCYSLQDVMTLFPDTKESDWRQVKNFNWIHKDARVSELLYNTTNDVASFKSFALGAIFRSGYYYGGYYTGGVFIDSEIYGGRFRTSNIRVRNSKIYSGQIYAGELDNCKMYGGTIAFGRHDWIKFIGGVYFQSTKVQGQGWISSITPLLIDSEVGTLNWCGEDYIGLNSVFVMSIYDWIKEYEEVCYTLSLDSYIFRTCLSLFGANLVRYKLADVDKLTNAGLKDVRGLVFNPEHDVNEY